MILQKYMNHVLLTLVGIVAIVGITAFFQAEMNSWPTRFKTSEEVEEAFDIRVGNITQILEQYGLQSIRLSDTHEEDHRSYVVYLSDGAHIRFGLYNKYPQPSYFSVSLLGSFKNNAEECTINIEQYPLFFEIAQALSNDRFHAERYQHLCSQVKKEADRSIAQGYTTGLLGDTKLRTTFFNIADIEYFINEEGEFFYPEIYVFSNAY
mgnify:CR=1 FL=1